MKKNLLKHFYYKLTILIYSLNFEYSCWNRNLNPKRGMYVKLTNSEGAFR